MKHIAIFVPEFPVASETFVITEIRALLAAGHKVSVLTMKRLAPNTQFEFDVFELNRKHLTATLKGGLLTSFNKALNAWRAARAQQGIRNLSLLYFAMQVNHFVKAHHISHIHCHFMHSSLAYGLVAAKYAGIRVSSVGHGHDVYVNASDLNAKLSLSDFNVAVCADMYKLLKDIKPEGIHLIHCGVDVAKFQHREAVNNATTKLLFVGRLVEKKGIEYALEAIADISQQHRPHLDIVGSGPSLTQLQRLADTLGISDSVGFLGQRTPEEIITLAQSYDAFIAPFCIAHNGDKDTGPVVLKEAMAMGLPTITTNVMGCTEIVDDSCGFIVPSRNSSALKHAILRFGQLTAVERSQMREAARQRVQIHFNALTQGLKLSHLIEGQAREH